MLVPLGYACDVAENGRLALHVLADRAEAEGLPPGESAYELVLLDMVMEDDFDGLDTLVAIRRAYPRQHFVLASGYSQTERVRQALDLGRGRYLAKPYTLEGLGRAVRLELDGRARGSG
jgi:CheY-like chemotaxis protein